MIVTRQRRKSFNFRRLILPAIAIVLLIVAFLWGPSRNVITSGPMSPVWRVAGNLWGNIAAPFHFAAQNEVITDRNRQIAQLQSQLATAQSSGGDKDKQISDLQAQIAQLQSQAASARAAAPPARRPGAAPGASPAAAGFGGGTGAGDLSAGATEDMKRTAQYWTSMDPENAAKIVQRLPPSYVARVFSLMQPDAVGAILDALPATYAAKLTQEQPQIQH